MKNYLVKLGLPTIVAIAATFSTVSDAGIILNFGTGSTSSNDPLTGASAEVTLTFSDVGSNVLISALVNNTTGTVDVTDGYDTDGDAISGDTATSAKLTAFGMDLVDPSEVTSFTAGSYLDTQIFNGSISPFGTIEYSIADNANLLGGNANDALPENTSDTISFTLSNSGLNAVDLEAAFLAGFSDGTLSYFTRFQQVDPGGRSDELSGGTVTSTTSTTVPEPSALALLALGLIGVGLGRRRLTAHK